MDFVKFHNSNPFCAVKSHNLDNVDHEWIDEDGYNEHEQEGQFTIQECDEEEVPRPAYGPHIPHRWTRYLNYKEETRQHELELEKMRVQTHDTLTFLREELGLHGERLAKYIASLPRYLLKADKSTKRATCHTLQNFGFKPSQIALIIARYPKVVLMNENLLSKRLASFKHIFGLTRQKVIQLVAYFPSVLGRSIEHDYQMVQRWLRLLRGDDADNGNHDAAKKSYKIGRKDSMYSDFYDADSESTVISEISLGNVGIESLLKRIIHGNPYILLHPEIFEECWDLLVMDLDLTTDQAARIMQCQPYIISPKTTQQLEEHLHFFVEELYLSPPFENLQKLIVRNPLLLFYSVEKRLRPNAEFLIECFKLDDDNFWNGIELKNITDTEKTGKNFINTKRVGYGTMGLQSRIKSFFYNNPYLLTYSPQTLQMKVLHVIEMFITNGDQMKARDLLAGPISRFMANSAVGGSLKQRRHKNFKSDGFSKHIYYQPENDADGNSNVYDCSGSEKSVDQDASKPDPSVVQVAAWLRARALLKRASSASESASTDSLAPSVLSVQSVGNHSYDHLLSIVSSMRIKRLEKKLQKLKKSSLRFDDFMLTEQRRLNIQQKKLREKLIAKMLRRVPEKRIFENVNDDEDREEVENDEDNYEDEYDDGNDDEQEEEADEYGYRRLKKRKVEEKEKEEEEEDDDDDEGVVEDDEYDDEHSEDVYEDMELSDNRHGGLFHSSDRSLNIPVSGSSGPLILESKSTPMSDRTHVASNVSRAEKLLVVFEQFSNNDSHAVIHEEERSSEDSHFIANPERCDNQAFPQEVLVEASSTSHKLDLNNDNDFEEEDVLDSLENDFNSFDMLSSIIGTSYSSQNDSNEDGNNHTQSVKDAVVQEKRSGPLIELTIDETTRLIRKMPSILSYRRDRTKRLLLTIAITLGLSPRELGNLIYRSPWLLSRSVDGSLRDIIEELGLAAKAIVADPLLHVNLTCSDTIKKVKKGNKDTDSALQNCSDPLIIQWRNDKIRFMVRSWLRRHEILSCRPETVGDRLKLYMSKRYEETWENVPYFILTSENELHKSLIERAKKRERKLNSHLEKEIRKQTRIEKLANTKAARLQKQQQLKQIQEAKDIENREKKEAIEISKKLKIQERERSQHERLQKAQHQKEELERREVEDREKQAMIDISKCLPIEESINSKDTILNNYQDLLIGPTDHNTSAKMNLQDAQNDAKELKKDELKRTTVENRAATRSNKEAPKASQLIELEKLQAKCLRIVQEEKDTKERNLAEKRKIQEAKREARTLKKEAQEKKRAEKRAKKEKIEETKREAQRLKKEEQEKVKTDKEAAEHAAKLLKIEERARSKAIRLQMLQLAKEARVRKAMEKKKLLDAKREVNKLKRGEQQKAKAEKMKLQDAKREAKRLVKETLEKMKSDKRAVKRAKLEAAKASRTIERERSKAAWIKQLQEWKDARERKAAERQRLKLEKRAAKQLEIDAQKMINAEKKMLRSEAKKRKQEEKEMLKAKKKARKEAVRMSKILRIEEQARLKELRLQVLEDKKRMKLEKKNLQEAKRESQRLKRDARNARKAKKIAKQEATKAARRLKMEERERSKALWIQKLQMWKAARERKAAEKTILQEASREARKHEKDENPMREVGKKENVIGE